MTPDNARVTVESLDTAEGRPHWTPVRWELLGWFRRNASPLAELYEGAVELTYGSVLPGRFRFIAHAVREIRNRLPEAISGTKRGGNLNYKDRLDEIAKSWQRSSFSLEGSVGSVTGASPSPSSAQISIPVPRPLFRRIARLVRMHMEARERPMEAAVRLFEGCAPENRHLSDTLRPVVEQWFQVTEWFMSNAHESGKGGDICDEGELRQQFELFESALGSLVRGFFTTVDQLDAILEDANS